MSKQNKKRWFVNSIDDEEDLMGLECETRGHRRVEHDARELMRTIDAKADIVLRRCRDIELDDELLAVIFRKAAELLRFKGHWRGERRTHY